MWGRGLCLGLWRLGFRLLGFRLLGLGPTLLLGGQLGRLLLLALALALRWLLRLLVLLGGHRQRGGGREGGRGAVS